MVILCPKNCWVMMLGDFLFVWWMFILMGGFERFFLRRKRAVFCQKKRSSGDLRWMLDLLWVDSLDGCAGKHHTYMALKNG
jgi:hypothetical protein